MPRSKSDNHLMLPFPAWPAHDQTAWQKATQLTRTPFRKEGGASARSPFTVTKVRNGYGRFLSFVGQHHERLFQVPAAERLSAEVLDSYFEHLIGRGNADSTIVCYFDDLRKAMSWMHPGQDFRFITSPHGSPLAWRLPMICKNAAVPHAGVFLACGRALFERGLAEAHPKRRQRRMRDAVLLGLLATAAPRIETLWQLQLHRHIQQRGEAWWFVLTPDILKTGRRTGCGLDMPVAPEVSLWLSRYVAVERTEMLGQQQHPFLWVTTDGTAMVRGGVATRVRVLTQTLLGTGYGPHAFRAALATTDAIENTDHPLDGALILGHTSPQMTLKHYNRANAMAAGRRHASRLKDMRKSLERDLTRLRPRGATGD